jgi:hypothetical protein
MPSINEQYDSAAAAEVRAIFRKSDELRNLLENELQRLEKNETFAANEFQQGAVRALIDLFRMVNGLANILIAQTSVIGTKDVARDDHQSSDSHIAA